MLISSRPDDIRVPSGDPGASQISGENSGGTWASALVVSDQWR